MFGRFRKKDEWDPGDCVKPRVQRPFVELTDSKSDDPVSVVVRNNSHRGIMKMLESEFGVQAASGRYFVPKAADVDRIAGWCASNGLYMKQSDMGAVKVLDVMTNKELGYK